jgi:hypothetical protein
MKDEAVETREETKKKKKVRTPKRAVFDRAVDRGLDLQAAANEANYAPRGGWMSQLANDPEIAKRIDEVALDRKWGGSHDLAPVINRLRDIALDTGITKSAAAIKEAREILLAIAQLKALLPRTKDVKVLDLQEEEWLAIYGKKS